MEKFPNIHLMLYLEKVTEYREWYYMERQNLNSTDLNFLARQWLSVVEEIEKVSPSTALGCALDMPPKPDDAFRQTMQKKQDQLLKAYSN